MNPQTLKKLTLYKNNPELIKEISNQELADLVVVVLGAVNQIENAIKDGRLDGFTPRPDKEYLSIDTARKMLSKAVNDMVSNYDVEMRAKGSALEMQVQAAIDRIRDGEDGIVSDEEIQRAAEIAFSLIEMPDFEKLVETALASSSYAVRDSLELIQEEEQKLEMTAVKDLLKTIEELRSEITKSKGVAGGGIGKNTVLQLIAENGGGVSDGDKGDITVSGDTWTINDAAVQMDDLDATGTPSSSTFLRGDGSWATPAGSGDMAAATYDPAGGAAQVAFQTMQDDLDMNGNKVIFTPDATSPAHAEGQLFYDDNEKALVFDNDESDVRLTIGQELWLPLVRNNTGSTITDGSVVYISGAIGQNPTIALAQANTKTTAEIVGIATHDIENNTNGYVTAFGYVRDIDTSAWNDGDVLYVDATTPGAMTTTKPTGSNYPVVVGTVAYSHATQGKILVNPSRATDVTDVVGAQEEPAEGAFVDGDKTKLDGIETGATADQVASEVPFTPAGNLASTDVQAALQELDTEKAAASHTHVLADVTDVTATAAEVNVLDGIPATLTATELGYVDGVTSAIQTQLNAKAPTASPTFTGTVTLPTGLTGVLRADTGVVSVDSDVTDIVSAASESAAGKVELATSTEIDTGTDATRAMSPDAFQASKRNIRWLSFNLVEKGTDCATGTNIGGDFVSPIAGTILQSDTTPFYLYATNSTAGTTGNMVVDININGTSIMTTNKLSFDSTEKTTTTSATPPDLTTTSLAVGDIISLDVDSVHTTAAKGLIVYMAVLED